MSAIVENQPGWLDCPPGAMEFKALDDNQGEIEGYASLFGELDNGNDIVVSGAFAKSLRKRRNHTSGQWLIPMLYGHAHQSVPVGVWNDFREDKTGLKVKGRILVESPDARQLYAVLKAGGAMGLSIGYRTIRKEIEERKRDGNAYMVRKLLEVDLNELSFTPMPMLEGARVTSVKSETDQRAYEAQARALIHAVQSLNDAWALKHAIEDATRKLRARS